MAHTYVAVHFRTRVMCNISSGLYSGQAINSKIDNAETSHNFIVTLAMLRWLAVEDHKIKFNNFFGESMKTCVNEVIWSF